MTDVKTTYSTINTMEKIVSFELYPFAPTRFYALTIDSDANDGGSNDNAKDTVNLSTSEKQIDNLDNNLVTNDGDDDINKQIPNITTLEKISLQGEKNDYYISATGDVIDKEGKVKYTKSEFESLSAEGKVEDTNNYTVVEVDGFNETIYLNDKKEFVNSKGEVVMSAEDVASKYDFSDTTNDDPFKVGLLASNLFENVDDIELSADSVSNVINTVFDKGITRGREDAIEELYSRYPKLKDVINYMELHGTDFSKFEQLPDYDSYQLSSDTAVGILDSIVEDWHKEKGIPVDKNYINYLKNGDNYLDYVNKLKNDLALTVKEKKQNLEKELQSKTLAAKKAADEYWGITIDNNGSVIDLNVEDSIYNKIIKTGSITVGNEKLIIPKVIRSTITGEPKEYTREDFFNWLYVKRPVELDGKRVNATGYDIYLYNTRKSRTLDHDLVDTFKAFTNGDSSQLIKQSVIKHIKSQKKVKVVPRNNNQYQGSVSNRNVKPKLTL